jgi:hypothetical protein
MGKERYSRIEVAVKGKENMCPCPKTENDGPKSGTFSPDGVNALMDNIQNLPKKIPRF